MSPFPTRGRRGQAERGGGKRIGVGGQWEEEGKTAVQRINDNEGERGWGAEWMVGREREGASAKMDRLSVCVS